MGQSQLPADVGEWLGQWTDRLSGPAKCPERLLYHHSLSQPGLAQRPLPVALAGQGSWPLLSCISADRGSHLLPPGPGSRSLQSKCKFTVVPCLYHLYWARPELTLDLGDKEPLEHASPACLSVPQRPQGVPAAASLLPSPISTKMVLQCPLAAAEEGDLQGRLCGRECIGWV